MYEECDVLSLHYYLHFDKNEEGDAVHNLPINFYLDFERVPMKEMLLYSLVITTNSASIW